MAWKRLLGLALALAAVAFVGRGASASSLHACNQTEEMIYIAVAGFDAEAQGLAWRSAGWYQVPAEDCRDFQFGGLLPQHLFLNANGESNELTWTGNFLFCVHVHDAFDLKGDRNCAGFGDGFAVRRFFHRRSDDGTYGVNFTH